MTYICSDLFAHFATARRLERRAHGGRIITMEFFLKLEVLEGVNLRRQVFRVPRRRLAKNAVILMLD